MSTSSSIETWEETLHTLFDAAVHSYSKGVRGASNLFTAEQVSALEGIGFRAQEIYDFVEDYAGYGKPTWETVLAIHAVRHEYFTTVQHGVLSNKQIPVESFPPKSEAIEGIEWLPRLIVKARAKLQGELPNDLMYCCGGDRRFFGEHNLDPALFLKKVWTAGNENGSIVRYVQTGV